MRGLSWKVALIDSCGAWPGAVQTSAFRSEGGTVKDVPVVADPTGHGSAIAALLASSEFKPDLIIGQVFLVPGATTPAAVGAAIDWAANHEARLIHLSLGLSADRPVIRAAVANALASGCIVVAATPARGAPVYPAAYAGVIRATGDARCEPGQWAVIDEGTYAGCVSHASTAAGVSGRGASVGAAWITRAILGCPSGATRSEVAAALDAGATYRGRERRGA